MHYRVIGAVNDLLFLRTIKGAVSTPVDLISTRNTGARSTCGLGEHHFLLVALHTGLAARLQIATAKAENQQEITIIKCTSMDISIMPVTL